MELSENVKYMKLLHELKGAFPNMADENIQQCIKQVSPIILGLFWLIDTVEKSKKNWKDFKE